MLIGASSPISQRNGIEPNLGLNGQSPTRPTTLRRPSRGEPVGRAGPAVPGQRRRGPGAKAAREGRPARVVIYRRPVEIRTKGRDERAALVHEVVVEQVAELLGLNPESVDPRYGED
ncbi:metallopeptidase family protein [Streptomyces scabiei]|uniref:metallopeptidase family protein n=1 Tax=Streptomyces scabiei TaxID=1930 RepID=UPI0038D4372A